MKKRVFIALNLPSEATEKLGSLLKQLKKINPKPQIRFVKPDSIHLTLHFLGDRDNREISIIKKVLLKIANQSMATTIVSESLNAFPDLKSPKVIYLEMREKNGSSLIKLQKKLGSALELNDIDVDHRVWRPHLTLARIPSPTFFKTDHVNLPNLEIPITSIELMESNLSSYGAKYTILESFNLKEKPDGKS